MSTSTSACLPPLLLNLGGDEELHQRLFRSMATLRGLLPHGATYQRCPPSNSLSSSTSFLGPYWTSTASQSELETSSKVNICANDSSLIPAAFHERMRSLQQAPSSTCDTAPIVIGRNVDDSIACGGASCTRPIPEAGRPVTKPIPEGRKAGDETR